MVVDAENPTFSAAIMIFLEFTDLKRRCLPDSLKPVSPKPVSPKLGFMVRV